MARLTFDIPDAKLERVKTAFKTVFAIPEDDQGNTLFTEAQWVNERIKQYIIDVVFRAEKDTAVRTINVNKDTGIVS